MSAFKTNETNNTQEPSGKVLSGTVEREVVGVGAGGGATGGEEKKDFVPVDNDWKKNKNKKTEGVVHTWQEAVERFGITRAWRVVMKLVSTGKWRELNERHQAFLHRALQAVGIDFSVSTVEQEADEVLASLSMMENFVLLAKIGLELDEFIAVDVGSKDGRISWHHKDGQSLPYFNETIGFTTGASFEVARVAIAQAVSEHPEAVLVMVGAGGYIMGKGGKLLADLYDDELPTDNAKASPLACGLQALLRDMRAKDESAPVRAVIPNRSVCSLAATAAIGTMLKDPSVEWVGDAGGAQWQIWHREPDNTFASYKFNIDFKSVKDSIEASLSEEEGGMEAAGESA